MNEVGEIRGALLTLVMLAVSIPAAAAGVQKARQEQPEPGPGIAHAALRRTLLGLPHRPGSMAVTAGSTGRTAGAQSRRAASMRSIVQAVPAAGGKRQVAYHVTPGYGVLGGPTTRPAVMALSGVRRRP
jgi:hypothetical protein